MPDHYPTLELRSPLRAALNRAYLAPENEHLAALLAQPLISADEQSRIQDLAQHLVIAVRERGIQHQGGVDAFMHEYDLSSQAGVMLMCLAEALLRIPDADTADRLIRDKLTQADWDTHLGNSPSLFVNASTWGLMLTGQIVKLAPEVVNDARSFLNRLISGSGEPVIRLAVKQAMKIIGHQFVMGRTIEEALHRSERDENRRYRHSFDMLGESALTAEDAERYRESYLQAIKTVGTHKQGTDIFDGPGISVKLSALHPRYEIFKRDRVMRELVPVLLEIAQAGKAAGINLTIDAEEAERLELSLDIFECVLRDSSLKDWDGLGLAVQAYQKRAPDVIAWLAELARSSGHRIPLRLVKGAYWDSEIKRAQERGLTEYPVYTRKISTDTSYLYCARTILGAKQNFYPQFATHNAHTLASIVVMAGNYREFEFQRLHGMGETLYDVALNEEKLAPNCRVYAPVGSHKDLLPYLVRRLLENGANTSFVNRIVDQDTPVEDIVADPVHELKILDNKRHPKIPLPVDIYGSGRKNSLGFNLADGEVTQSLLNEISAASSHTWNSGPIIGGERIESKSRAITNPTNQDQIIGHMHFANDTNIERALTLAAVAAPEWGRTPAAQRAAILEKAADLFEEHRSELIALCIREGGRTLVDALNEVREAIDFCRYYALLARQEFDAPKLMPGVTGERNELRLCGRGVFVCISPWNFPVAIFTGQITAALAAGNSVIAKPAGLTPLCAAHVIQLLHQAGIPGDVLHLLPGSGSALGAKLLNDPRISGVAFTGSTDTARLINQTLAQQTTILPLIAETGGQNVMIADSSALPEQVMQDAMISAFNSAGQRCSALRVLFVQQELAPRIIKLMQGAMDQLQIGDPSLLVTDIGPVISHGAVATLKQHADRMAKEATLIHSVVLPAECSRGSFFAPRVYEIDSLGRLQGEVFGPILHVVRYQANHLNHVIDAINNAGYGLTLGIHSRIDATVRYISQRVRAGNTYVNRNMIGAVVGSQPFGGEGLSGTGPKAGGPHYLHRFATERTLTINTAAVGGNASLLAIEK
ncbi:MAG: bifunctional proline dehydrogenase/L-glutamate gamma-semialdehyde dehydrogenase PutA [Gammaproteobacteria bacterium]|nr:bifunctional proline dehydrogenase/L-glutamate gamma-semialdehyde dehydrogenase PutA [Gammaproteobacteria bacterium]